MPNLHFSLDDYQAGLAAGQYTPPEALCPPYYVVDPVLFNQQANSGQRRDNLEEAQNALRARTGRVYFQKTYPLQARTLDYSARTFPAYRFILPEVMSEDWLAIVDWGKFQRDHVLHQPLCGYVVLKLLDGDGVKGPLLLPGGKTILDTCVAHILRWEETAFIRDFLLECGMSPKDKLLANTRLSRQVWRTFFREAAYVAAVFHDLGYPWQYAERIQCNLSGMNSTAISKNRSASQIVEQFSHRLLLHALRGYKKPDAASPSHWSEKVVKLTDKALSKTHGLPGALGFLHLNDSVRSYPHHAQSPLHLLCVEWAAVAIMMHDMGNIYWGNDDGHIPTNEALRLSFNRDPLSAIVTLADVLQDFERPTAAFNPTSHSCPAGSVAIKYDTACLATELDLTGRNLTINYRMSNPNMCANKRNFIVKEEKTYFDPRYGFLDMQSLGIDNVQLKATV